jgi:hypothetical protein
VTSGPPEPVVLGYLTLVYDAATDTMEPVENYELPDGHLHVLMAIGAAATRLEAYTGPSRPVQVTVPGYVVASVESFARQPVPEMGAGGTSYTAASRALRRQVEGDPAARGALTIASAEVAA